MKKLLVTLTTCALLVGCSTMYQVIVTICDAEDAAMQAWATAHNDHKTSVQFDQSVMKVHSAFLSAKLAAKVGLQAYKTNGDKQSYIAALEAVRAAAQPVIDLVSGIVSQQRAKELNTMLKTAKSIGVE